MAGRTALWDRYGIAMGSVPADKLSSTVSRAHLRRGPEAPTGAVTRGAALQRIYGTAVAEHFSPHGGGQCFDGRCSALGAASGAARLSLGASARGDRRPAPEAPEPVTPWRSVPATTRSQQQ